MPNSIASVKATTPARTIARAGNHFKHRVPVHRNGDDVAIEFAADARCDLHAADGQIEIKLSAADAETLTRLEGVVAKHLKQVAVPEELEVSWVAE